MRPIHSREEHPTMTDDHDHGLSHDLRALMSRRRAMGLMLTAASAGLAACDRIPFLSNAEAEVAASGPDGKTCVVHPAETAGPFPADGSNRAHGTLANVLADSGIVRTDMRENLSGKGEKAAGTELRLTLSLVAVASSCEPLANHAIYLWHCDAEGRYSLYELPDRTYLRAVGVTNSKGEIEFTTIVPGCYNGRYPHMHFEIYRDLAAASDYRNRLLTSQLVIPASVCKAVYAGDAAYGQSLEHLAGSPLESDMIFADNTANQLAAQTPAFEREADGSYTGRVTIGIKPVT